MEEKKSKKKNIKNIDKKQIQTKSNKKINDKDKSNDITQNEKKIIEDKTIEINERTVNFLPIICILIIVLIVIVFFKFNYSSLAHIKIVNDNLTNVNDGLYEDNLLTGYDENEPFSSKYYFKGSDVNNYLIFENSCWQILNITQNNHIKVMFLGESKNNKCENINYNNINIVWSNDKNNDWMNSNLKKELENWVYNNKIFNSSIDFTSKNSLIANAEWFIGGVKFSGNRLQDNIANERDKTLNKRVKYNGKLGLINITDYLKAGCQKSAYDAIEACGDNNFLYKDINYWTLNKTIDGELHVWAIENGMSSSILTDNENYAILPVVYLKPNLSITGNGTIVKPYIVR